jgi:hypothetical protein
MTPGSLILMVWFEIDRIGANRFGIDTKEEAFAVPRIDAETPHPILTVALDFRHVSA